MEFRFLLNFEVVNQNEQRYFMMFEYDGSGINVKSWGESKNGSIGITISSKYIKKLQIIDIQQLGVFTFILLSDKDSNLDKQYQKLRCYHYTIGHR